MLVIKPFTQESFLLKMSFVGGSRMLEKEININNDLQSFNTSLCITMNRKSTSIRSLGIVLVKFFLKISNP